MVSGVTRAFGSMIGPIAALAEREGHDIRVIIDASLLAAAPETLALSAVLTGFSLTARNVAFQSVFVCQFSFFRSIT